MEVAYESPKIINLVCAVSMTILNTAQIALDTLIYLCYSRIKKKFRTGVCGSTQILKYTHIFVPNFVHFSPKQPKCLHDRGQDVANVLKHKRNHLQLNT